MSLVKTTPLQSKGIVYHTDLIQGSDEWLAARCGMLTASEMKLIITPTLKIASNEKERAHLPTLPCRFRPDFSLPVGIGATSFHIAVVCP